MHITRTGMSVALAMSPFLGPILAHAAPLGLGFFGYGAAVHLGPGYDYENFPPAQLIAPLADDNFVSGTFLDADYSKEYILDSSGAFFTVDTATGAVTQIGTSGLSPSVHLSIAASTGAMYALTSDENCQSATLYLVDVTTGEAQLIGSSDFCIQSIAFDASGTLYELDTADGNVVVVANGISVALGPLGIAAPFNDTSALAVDPVTNTLYLFQIETNPDPPEMVAYMIDTTTGAATFAGSIGTAAILAIALAPPPSASDTIFVSGFD